MKFKRTFVGVAIVAFLGFAAVAQDRVNLARDRIYVRQSQALYMPEGNTVSVEYHFTESDGEIGYRYVTGLLLKDPCSKGFIKLTKSVESETVLYLTEKNISTCPNFRFVFPNGDLSAGYVQSKLPNGEFLPVLERLTEWKVNGVKPNLLLKY